MCTGKIIARVFDRVRTYHQKFTARVRRVISARSSRAEAAQGLNARRKAHHRSRAFEATQRVIHKKVGLMPFEIARPGHRISVPAQECRVAGAPLRAPAADASRASAIASWARRVPKHFG